VEKRMDGGKKKKKKKKGENGADIPNKKK